MKVSQIGIIAVVLVVIAVALAGCTGSGTSPATPAAGGAASTAAPSGGSGAAAAATSDSSSGPVTAGSLFGNIGYNWAEYKMSAGQGADQMIIYLKYSKDGKCSMRFEGAGASQMPSNMQNIDCSKGSATTGQSQANPNDVQSDAKLVKVGTESVTVGAGTFVADKYTVTNKDGNVGTYWIANGKPLLKMEAASGGQGSVVMELNGWG